MNLARKEIFRNILRLSRSYRREYNSLDKKLSTEQLEHIICDHIKNVPYYNKYEQYLKGGFDIAKFPILTKDDILGHEREFVSKKQNPRFCLKAETGGSSGKTLSLFYSLDTLKRKDALPDSLFARFDCDGLNVAMLRGTKPANGKLCEVINRRLVVLSSYRLTSDNVEQYVNVIQSNNITCLHVYPSSITILAKLIKDKYGSIKFPHLKGIFASSEIFDKEDQKLVREVFGGVDIIDYYGMSELCCAAYSLNGGNYVFNQQFGFVEFLDTGERSASGFTIAKIIATSVMNTTMPLIRYDTGDMAEIDDNGNVLSIIGRTSDFVYNKNDELMPCILLTRNKSLENVVAFQFYQPRHGELQFHVIVNKHYSEENKQSLMSDLVESFPLHLMDCSVVVKDKLKRSPMGKLLRLVSDC